MSSGATRASSRATAGAGDDRSRLGASAAAHNLGRSDRPSLRKASSPQPDNFASTSHKRSASGRPLARTTTEERRITERTYEAQYERIVPRHFSPERQPQRRTVPVEKKAEVSKAKSVESRSQSRADTPQGRSFDTMRTRQ